MSQITLITPVPLFGGQSVFGDYDSFAHVTLQHSTASGIDSYLGLTDGSTLYGADPGGHLFAVSGQFLGVSSDAVNGQLTALQNYAGIVATYRRPTGDIYPSNAWHEHNCYFTLGDMAAGTVQQIGLNWFGLTYKLVLRQIPKG